jgi:quinol monooxygenase YgiN
MFAAIAIHYASPEHTDEMLAFMQRVVEATDGAPGLVEFRACRELSRGALAGYSRWQSQNDFEAALPTIRSLGRDLRAVPALHCAKQGFPLALGEPAHLGQGAQCEHPSLNDVFERRAGERDIVERGVAGRAEPDRRIADDLIQPAAHMLDLGP